MRNAVMHAGYQRAKPFYGWVCRRSSVRRDVRRLRHALAAAHELLVPTRAQPGCMDYVWAADSATPGRIYVYERWADEPSLSAHFAGPWYRKMLAAIGKYGIRKVDVLKYRIDLAEPVYDREGKARADFFTAPR